MRRREVAATFRSGFIVTHDYEKFWPKAIVTHTPRNSRFPQTQGEWYSQKNVRIKLAVKSAAEARLNGVILKFVNCPVQNAFYPRAIRFRCRRPHFEVSGDRERADAPLCQHRILPWRTSSKQTLLQDYEYPEEDGGRGRSRPWQLQFGPHQNSLADASLAGPEPGSHFKHKIHHRPLRRPVALLGTSRCI